MSIFAKSYLKYYPIFIDFFVSLTTELFFVAAQIQLVGSVQNKDLMIQ